MRIKIISDQHREFMNSNQWEEYLRRFHNPVHLSDQADICVIAGDFDVVRGETVKSFEQVCEREKHVIYVPGNHDYYHRQDMSNVEAALDQIEALLKDKLTILRSEQIFHLQGRRFLGDTMWVPHTPKLVATRHLINDSIQIEGFFFQMPARHERCMDFFRAEMRTGDIVVTHHLPSDMSTPDIWKGEPTQPWFVAEDAEALLQEKAPALWIHGHTHKRCDYMLGSTRVVCNPLGYPSENGSLRWVKPMIIEL